MIRKTAESVALVPEKVSVVIPSLTDGNALQKTLLSVFSQVNVRTEAVVVSPQPEPSGLDFGERAVLKWIRDRPRGIYEAMNLGLQFVSAEWIAFLGAGDTFHAADTCCRMLQLRGSRAAREPVTVVYGRAQFIDAETPTFRKYGWAPPRLMHHWGMPFPHVGTLFHRNLFQEFGGFDEGFRLAGDFDWISRVISQGKRMQSAGFVTVTVDQAGVSNRSSTRRKAIWEESLVLKARIADAFLLGVILRALKLLYNLGRIAALSLRARR